MAIIPDKLYGPSVFDDIHEMHETKGIRPDLITPEFFKFRLNFLREELNETVLAARKGDAEGVVDGLIDLIVVAVGTLDLLRVDGQKAWDEVHRKNMQKVKGQTKRDGSGGFDLLKPSGWTSPNHSDNLGIIHTILPMLDDMQLHQNEIRFMLSSSEYPSIKVLSEVAEKIVKKGEDYNFSIKRGAYFIHGVDDIVYEAHKKLLRIRSVLEKLRQNKTPNFESLEDSIIDNIAYQTFMMIYIRGEMDGQDPDRDIFNQEAAIIRG